MKKNFWFSLAIVVILVVIFCLFLTQTPPPAPLYNPLISSSFPTSASPLSAWIPWWDQTQSLISLSSASGQLASLSPTWYLLTPDLTLARQPYVRYDDLIRPASASAVPLIPLVGNELDGSRADRFLSDASLWPAALNFLAAEAGLYGYTGYDFDWETLAPAQSEAYAGFIGKARQTFAPLGLKTVVTVHARTGSARDWTGALGHDYALLGEAADEVRIMAYDYHSPLSRPGPLTPLPWLDDVISYSLKQLPPGKITLGLPMYGYDWSASPTANLTYQAAMNLANRYQVLPKRDTESGALTYSYTDAAANRHHVWFEDAVSLRQKIGLAQKRGIQRFIIWRLGGEDPALWTALHVYTNPVHEPGLCKHSTQCQHHISAITQKQQTRYPAGHALAFKLPQ